jgi:hypothetical protein
MHEGEEEHIKFWWDSQKERGYCEDLDIDRGILKLILETQVEVLWTGFIWLRLGTSGGILWTQ